MMNFCTVLHSLNSPQNVGMIVRSHAAHAGQELVFTGHKLPWEFKKGSQSFSRKLEKMVSMVHIPEPVEAIEYVLSKGYKPIAVEISEQAVKLGEYRFESPTALIMGNEAIGLPKDFLGLCDATLVIPQYSSVGSLNVAVAASIVMYEFRRGQKPAGVVCDEYV